MKVDKYGKCPCCEDNWNGGDILEGIGSLDVLIHSTTKEKLVLAQQYGWSEEKPTKFSRVITHEKSGRVLYQCPAIRCGKVFDANTGEQFNGMESVWAKEKNAMLAVMEEEMPPIAEENKAEFAEMFNSIKEGLKDRLDEKFVDTIIYGTPGELPAEDTEQFYQPPVNTVLNKRIESFSSRLKSFKKK